MRVNVDSMALADPRFKRLAGRLHITWHEALGRCLPVWMHAYEKRSAEMAVQDVDALGEVPGLSDAMVAVDLATHTGPDRVRLRGVDARIEFLLTQDAKREKANAARRSKGARGEGPPDARGTSPGAKPGHGPYSPDPDQAQPLPSPRPRGLSPGTPSGDGLQPGDGPEAKSAMLRDSIRRVGELLPNGELPDLLPDLALTSNGASA